MIIDDPDVISVIVTPDKADAPSIVGTNAIQTGQIAPKLLKTIGRRNHQVHKRCPPAESIPAASLIARD